MRPRDTMPNQTDTPGAPSVLCRRKPPHLPANTTGQRAADVVVRIGDAYRGWLYVAVIVALLVLSGFLPERAALGVEVLAFTLGATYCLANFWRCREPHCVVTGFGWAALTVFTVVELVLGGSLIGGFEQLVFLGILVLGCVFEATWRVTTGTNTLRRQATTHPISDDHSARA